MVDDPAAPGLRIESARKHFVTPEGGQVRALDGVDLTISPGEFFVMLGPSGCGKTTLLRSIAGLEYLDGGTITLDGKRIDQLPPYRRPVNTVFQSYALFPHLTVAQNIAFGLEMDGVDKATTAATVERMLALVHLSGLGRRRPSQLSGGQQQRVALARALAKKPRVLLLDEPLAALDLKLRRGMQAELKAIQQTTGVTFVFVTHDQEEALSMGDRIAVFDSGRIRQVGTPAEIYERPVDRFVADFIGETSFLTLDVRAGADGGLTAHLPGGTRVPVPQGLTTPGTVTVAVRPERVQVGAGGSDGSPDGAFDGVVRQAVYMGTDQRCEVDVDGSTLKVRLPAASGARLSVGDRVRLSIEPQHLRVLADDVAADDAPDVAGDAAPAGGTAHEAVA